MWTSTIYANGKLKQIENGISPRNQTAPIIRNKTKIKTHMNGPVVVHPSSAYILVVTIPLDLKWQTHIY